MILSKGQTIGMIAISPKEPGRLEGSGKKHFPSAESKELSAQDPVFSENIIEEYGGNQDILGWKATKGICGQLTYLILKEWLKEVLETEG